MLKTLLFSALFSIVTGVAQASIIVPDGFGHLVVTARDKNGEVSNDSPDYTKLLSIRKSSSSATAVGFKSGPSGPSVRATASTSGSDDIFSAFSQAYLGYYFAVSGPADSVSVTIKAEGGTSSSAFGNGGAGPVANFQVTGL